MGKVTSQFLQSQADVWERFIPPDAHAIDIGAHCGDTTVPMAMLAASVTAFEANPAVFPTLLANAALPGLAPTECINKAAWHCRDTLLFHYNDGTYCNGGLLLSPRTYEVNHTAPLSVAAVPLVAYLQPNTRFLKLDTEGNDHRILAGIREFLDACHPTIQTEIYMDLDAGERAAYAAFLLGLGYKLYHTDLSPVTALPKHGDIYAHYGPL